MSPRDGAAEYVITQISKLRHQAKLDREESERLSKRAAQKALEADYLAALLEASALGTDPKVHIDV